MYHVALRLGDRKLFRDTKIPIRAIARCLVSIFHSEGKWVPHPSIGPNQREDTMLSLNVS